MSQMSQASQKAKYSVHFIANSPAFVRQFRELNHIPSIEPAQDAVNVLYILYQHALIEPISLDQILDLPSNFLITLALRNNLTDQGRAANILVAITILNRMGLIEASDLHYVNHPQFIQMYQLPIDQLTQVLTLNGLTPPAGRSLSRLTMIRSLIDRRLHYDPTLTQLSPELLGQLTSYMADQDIMNLQRALTINPTLVREIGHTGPFSMARRQQALIAGIKSVAREGDVEAVKYLIETRAPGSEDSVAIVAAALSGSQFNQELLAWLDQNGHIETYRQFLASPRRNVTQYNPNIHPVLISDNPHNIRYLLEVIDTGNHIKNMLANRHILNTFIYESLVGGNRGLVKYLITTPERNNVLQEVQGQLEKYIRQTLYGDKGLQTLDYILSLAAINLTEEQVYDIIDKAYQPHGFNTILAQVLNLYGPEGLELILSHFPRYQINSGLLELYIFNLYYVRDKHKHMANIRYLIEERGLQVTRDLNPDIRQTIQNSRLRAGQMLNFWEDYNYYVRLAAYLHRRFPQIMPSLDMPRSAI